jgi:hypothetical protein
VRRDSIAAIVLLAASVGGCTDSDSDSSADTATTTARRVASMWPLPAVHFTVNRQWSQADWDALHIAGTAAPWEGRPFDDDPVYEPGQIVAFTTRLRDYRQQRTKCEEEFHDGPRNSLGEATCYPDPTEIDPDTGEVVGTIRDRDCKRLTLSLARIRYGRYCGRNFPDHGVWLDNRRTRSDPSLDVDPVDGIDYCCRLHDALVWDPTAKAGAASQDNSCGWVMCAMQASAYPANALDTYFTAARDARQCIYDRANLAPDVASAFLACDTNGYFLPSNPPLAPAPDAATLPAPPQTRLSPKTGVALQF